MMMRRHDLDRIRSGEVTLAFRRWKRPTVKAGGSRKTAIGVVRFGAVDRVSLGNVTDAEVGQAGYGSRDEMVEALGEREGDLYRVEVSYEGEDPRIALRESDDLSEEEIEGIVTRLARMDSRAPAGPWTKRYLELVRDHPARRAGDLAEMVGAETQRLKLDVRKLKNLGLTISLGTGYELSPRGKVVLGYLRRERE